VRPRLRSVPWVKAVEPAERGERRHQVRGPERGPRFWNPDTLEERLAAWEWEHPRLAFLVGALIFGAAGILLAVCLVGEWLP